MSTVKYNLRVYAIRTPKYMKRKDIEVDNNRIKRKHFEMNVLENFFEGLKILADNDRRLQVNISRIDDTCEIKFIDYVDYNENYSYFILETDRYGTERPIKDMEVGVSEKKLYKHESVPITVYLVINKRHSLMYVTKDRNTIINKSSLNSFFHNFRFILYQYIELWNEKNKNTPYKIFKRPAIKVDTLPSMDFFHEIDKLQSVKEFSYSFDPSGTEDTPDFDDMDKMSQAGFSRRDLKETRTFQNMKHKRRIDKVKKLFEDLYGKSNFDDFYVKGTNNYGDEKVVKPDFTTRVEPIQLSNITEVQIEEVISEIDKLLSVNNNNPLFGKIQNLDGVSEVEINYEEPEVIERIVSDFKNE